MISSPRWPWFVNWLSLPFFLLILWSCTDRVLRIVPVATVEVTGPNRLLVGETGEFSARPRGQMGNALPDRPCTWSASDPSAASVVSTTMVGRYSRSTVLALSPNPTGIVATCEGVSGSLTVQMDSPIRPEVVSVTPALGADVGLLQDITLTFSQPMDPSTLNAQTVSVSPMAGGLHLSYDAATRKLWLAPDSLFPPQTDLALAVSSGATNTSGIGLEPFSVGFTTGPYECAYLQDRFEPNDDLTTPSQVEPDSLVIGLSTCMDDEDYFRVTVTDTTKLTARTHVTYADTVSWGMHWLREDGEWYATLGTRARTGSSNSYYFTFLPGSYLLYIFGHDEEELVLYDLVLESSEPCVDDSYEDNDFRDEAASVSPGVLSDLRGCHVDHDWFSVPVSAGQTITLTLDTGDYTYLRRMAIYEPGGGYIGDTGQEEFTKLSLAATADGTAYVYALFWRDLGPYELDIGLDRPEVVSVTPALGADVGLLQDITLTFSQPMDPSTLNAQTVSVSPMAGALHLSYDEGTRTLWLAPDSLFPPQTNLTLAVSSGATNTSGIGLEPFSVGFTTGPYECAYLQDRLEPNDALTTPSQVEPDSLVIGLSTCMDDKDYFRVTVTDTTKLTARTYMTYADMVGWGMHWLREDGEWYATLGTTATTGYSYSSAFTFLPGSYLLYLFGHEQEDLVLYDLALESSEPCVDDAYEDNDFRDEAASVSPGLLSDLRGCYGDHDWFSVPVSAGQTITLTVDTGDYTYLRRLGIYEPGGSSSVHTGQEEFTNLSLAATADGTALVYAMFWRDLGPYELTIDVGGE